MKAKGNGAPETCVENLLRLVRGEVPFDRVRGLNGALIDQPNTAPASASDARWLIETYEPRVVVESVDATPEDILSGDFSTFVNIRRKEETE